MNSLMIPPNPNWFMQSTCHCTPDNGLLYGAMTKVVYIPPKTEVPAVGIKVFNLKNKLCSFSADPDWTESKRFALINSDFNVLVYDFATGEPVKGHRGHESAGNQSMNNHQAHTAIAFLKQNSVISSVNSNVILYCLLSNTFKIYLDLSTRNPISILKQSPKDSNLVAAGTKNGLILLIGVDKMEVITKLRGHDTEIASLDWIYLSMVPTSTEPLAAEPKISLQNLIAATDSSDMFDIYEDNTEQEFGVYAAATKNCSDDEEDNAAEIQEKIVSNSNFNYLEACNNLKTQILADENGSSDCKKASFADNKDKYGMANPDNQSVDESLESNASSRTPVLTEESLNYLDECQRMKDFVIVTKEEIEQVDYIPVLASGAREQVAWLWDVNERTGFCKIKWHPKTRPALPSPFTNVLWIDQNTLLVTDSNGDINEYQINLDINARTLTYKEQKDKKFDAKGVLNMCKSDNGSVIWTSSIHRHISCLEIKEDFKKVISLDTIQLRIHFIVENPIDSNVIAIGGNDKRICLWNTSEANHDFVALRPFMNKIHSGVLNLSWHPEKDNIIAFSTREGRIGVLDVNKSSNVPTVLSSFSSQEVYSIAWAKMSSNGNDFMILIACNGHKLVYYNQKESWKMTIVDHLKHSASIAVNAGIMAVGNGNGELMIVDINKKFFILMQKKISRKYIGMMTWHGNSLAISSEAGITLIKHIDEATKQISDQDLLHLVGHKGRVFSVRFNKTGSLLVSSCVSGYVKVWDVETLTAISSFKIDTLAYTAIFLPTNEDFIVCGGQDSTVMLQEWAKYSVEEEVAEVVSKKKAQHPHKNISWAEPTEVTTISKNSQRRQKKKIVKVVDDSVSELSSDIVKLNLHPKKPSSVFHLANREMSSNHLDYIEKMMSYDERELSVNEMIFGSRLEVKKVIEMELEQQKHFNQKGINGVVLPQLNDALKTDILERIVSKTLTEVHVSISPSVSFDLWRKCCFAYGAQCIDNEDSLTAIPYLLAVNDVENCVNQLCDGKFFREAWVIAKMRKQDSDPIFETIFKKWIKNYENDGNFEAAAALLVCKKNFKLAAEMLDKRQNRSDKCTALMKLLSSKTE